MKKNDYQPEKEKKEFTATDVVDMYNSVDIQNGVDIKLAINIRRCNKKILSQ